MPLLTAPVREKSGLSRAVVRRIEKAAMPIRRANECIAAVNALYGHCSVSSRLTLASAVPETTLAQRSAQTHIIRCCRLLEPQPEDLTRAGAIVALRATDMTYGIQEVVGAVAPLIPSKLSLPDVGWQPRSTVAELKGEPRTMLMRFETLMLKDHEVWGRDCDHAADINMYVDPGLRNDRGKYIELLRMIRQRNLSRFSARALGMVGIFTVKKKN